MSHAVAYLMYSPRMWRWSLDAMNLHVGLPVFSTYVEVIPTSLNVNKFEPSILHVCGGDPFSSLLNHRINLYSPRMWRWSRLYFALSLAFLVFSTYVEVIPLCGLSSIMLLGILHVCGGDPIGDDDVQLPLLYSPRMWRWSHPPVKHRWRYLVFSTYVEVIPWDVKHYVNLLSILHVCGGDPIS